MGVTIQCTKTYKSIDMGYGGFNSLRNKVAELAGEPFASHYQKLFEPEYMFCFDSEDRKRLFDEYNAKTERMVKAGEASIKIVDFCLQSDCGGCITHKQCRKILEVIGDYDDNICYGYVGRRDCAMFKDFKEILKDCVKHKCDMVWR